MSDVHLGGGGDHHQRAHTTATEKNKQIVDVSGLYLQVLNTKDKQGIQGFLYFAKFFQEIIVISSRHHLHYKKRAWISDIGRRVVCGPVRVW